MPIDLVCLDADDTLWHNMRFFDAAERAFAELVAPYAEAPAARARMEAIEVRNLKHYGYGAKSFTLSMIETALELAGDALPAASVRRLLEIGRTLLDHPVELLDDVAATLDRLAAAARLVLVTKGDLLHQEVKLAASGLGGLFTGVEIVSDKRAETFVRVFHRYGCAPERAVMAGDSLRSDVLPALAAGAWGAYVPQPLAWSHEAAAVPADHPRFRQLARLGDLPDWIATIG
ncbi:HAD family hydrolase [Sphingomonas sp. BK235]|jgi:putative hydrolase of the HAD superfamily|uniref:HAD family hydrolase n=1 Tax=Sphingomonas sp. BK235 TaxID=2512131 RepID=UPI0010454703|nr:HAD family hydrolase [Sphingomonas sp. BK235]TCP34267.1 putative hydrolase of the HAD superfamily [Sphingomonas sp. BK235]